METEKKIESIYDLIGFYGFRTSGGGDNFHQVSKDIDGVKWDYVEGDVTKYVRRNGNIRKIVKSAAEAYQYIIENSNTKEVER